MDWRPEIGDGEAPAYQRIVEALEADIAGGALTAGARLPTQRALARRLGLSIGTVTRAYTEAGQRGLIGGVVGRGSFVASGAAPAVGDGTIDLSRNLPPMAPAKAALRAAMAAIAKRGDLAERLDYAPDGGFAADRQAAAAWLARAANFPDADPARIVMTSGAQQAIFVALAAACRPGEALIVEAATFHGVKLAAAQAGLRLVPAELDAEGLTPEALSRAAAQSGARAAYVQPYQNPTARVMSLERRRAIITAAERAGVLLIEDDLYGPIVGALGLPPLAQLAPEAVAYVSGLSKSLGPGLRTGFLIPPERIAGPVHDALRVVAFGPPSFSAPIGTHWIETGEAFDILDAVRRELAGRTALAQHLLDGLIERPAPAATSHLWAPVGELDAERVAGAALRAGVRLTAPAAPFVAGAPVSGLRICLGAAPDLQSLERGLSVVATLLQPGRSLAENVV
ncbi:MAG TPA: PLP-dependent aminotransferase family protein [Caulobacteraceae bacterium]|nr:PLP-dependent aminotransferase family protein [Caulobacteraceae bacterium]